MPSDNISIRSLSGGIFWSIALAVVLYVIGFLTNGWEQSRDVWVGLWSTCYKRSYSQTDDWFKATQAMITIGLILLVVCFSLIFIHMFISSVSVERRTLMKVFTVMALLAVASMLTGFIIFGTKHSLELHWSYALSVAGSALCFIAALLSIVQLRR